jgi:DNA modification methylase
MDPRSTHMSSPATGKVTGSGSRSRLAGKGPRHAFGKESRQSDVVDPRNSLNDLSSVEWLPETISVWTQRGLGAGHPDAKIEREHPAPFSFTDVSRLIRFFTRPGGVVLDPFLGVGSTSKACALEGRKSIGFELNPRYAELAVKRLRTEVRDLFSNKLDQDVRVGDARDLVRDVSDDSIDFIVTSPPSRVPVRGVSNGSTG